MELPHKKVSMPVIMVLIVAFSFAEKPTGKSLPSGFATNDIFRSKAFIENKDLIQPYKGEEVKFMMSYKGMQAFFTTEGLVYKMSEAVEKKESEKEREKEPEEARDLKNYFVHMKWLGVNANCEIVAEENQHVDHVYMKRNGEEFSTVRTNAYSRIVYKNIYEGIDAVYTLEEKGGIKYNLVLHKGADASQIKMAYDGDVKNVRLDNEGNVVIATKAGKITDHAPHTFSETNVVMKSSFELKGKTVQFHLPENYDRNQTITIDPWVTNNNVLSFYEGGFTVDYDYLGNLFVYGGGWSGEPYKVAAYPLAGGAPTYVFNGTVGSISWSSQGVENDPGNIVVERTTGKVYIGEGVQDLGARIVRLAVNGNYDNFVSTTNSAFIECWGLVFNCGTGKIYLAGGSYNDATDFGILDPVSANVVTSNITGNTVAIREDIACMAQNSVGDMYTLFSEPYSSQPGAPFGNYIFKLNPSYTGTVWNVPTGYTSMIEFNNHPYYDFSASGNGFNALAANNNYVYYYDGQNVKAFSSSNGATAGSPYSIPGYAPLIEGGIAVDECDHVYVGGIGVIKTFTFNGSNFVPGADISLGVAYANDSVYDIKFNSSNNLLYVTGTQFTGTYVASLSINCNTSTVFTIATTSTCSSATVTVTPTGGVNPVFTYFWYDSTGAIVRQINNSASLTDVLTGVAEGTYVVKVFLNLNCSSSFSSDSVTIGTNITLSVSDTTICSGKPVNLTATANVPGGTFNWQPGGAGATINVSPTTTTVYTVTYTVPGCAPKSSTCNITVQPCCNISALVTQVQPACGGNNGSINVTPSPAGNYTYLWNDASPLQNRTGLAAGIYTVTITDVNTPTCTFDTTITLNSSSTLNLSFSNPVNPTCAGDNGSITVNLSGGTAPYVAHIDTGGAPFNINVPVAGSLNIPGLNGVTITVTVTDAAGCISNAFATLVAPANCCTFTISAAVTQPACAQTNGSVVLTTANGSGNYTYSWGGGQNTSSVTSVGAGNYPVTITDVAFANCSIDTSFSLINPNAPVINSATSTTETCAGNDGTATVAASGGTGALTIAWSNGGNTFTITSLASDTFDFTVTDATGCSTTGSVIVPVLPGCCFLQTSFNLIPPTCGLNNGTITVNITTAGTPPYTYSIDGVNFQAQNIFTNVAPGNYNVVTQDVNLCSFTVPVVVPVSSSTLSVTISQTDVTCFGMNDGTATANPLGGNPAYSYFWSSASNMSAITNLSPGNYILTVTDQTNCQATASVTITQPAQVIVNLGNDTTLCIGLPMMLDAGSGFATYLWNTNEITQTIVPQNPGIYSVSVTDVNGCSASDVLNVNFVPLPVIDLGSDLTAYEGTNIGIFSTLVLSNGSGGTYNWLPDTLLSCGACANTVAYAADTITYTLVYHDQFGCPAQDDVTLFVLPIGTVYFPNAFTPTGDGNNDIYYPYGTSSVKQISWAVFNRWGEKVFESNSLYIGWDGTYKGAPAPMGVYVVSSIVTQMNNSSRKYKGSVTLIR